MIRYVGSHFDPSGYGNAARKNLVALDDAGIPVTGHAHSFQPDAALIESGELQRLNALLNRNASVKYNIVHLTPENFQYFMFPGALNVGHFAWETSRLPGEWVAHCNRMDLILVPSEWNKKVTIESGVKVPVEVYPHAYNTRKFEDVKPLPLLDQYKDHLKFYSVFQWSERKNPYGLLRAYLSEFSRHEKVVLILKTYSGAASQVEVDIVMRGIANAKAMLFKSEPLPKAVLLSKLLSESEVDAIHVSCDCMVAPVRGEGFGMPILDAVLAGKQVIATNYSAHTEFLRRDLHYLIPYQMHPVQNMTWIRWYSADQEWADPDICATARAMRDVYKKWASGQPIRPRIGLDDENFLPEIAKRYDANNVSLELVKTLEKYAK